MYTNNFVECCLFLIYSIKKNSRKNISYKKKLSDGEQEIPSRRILFDSKVTTSAFKTFEHISGMS